MPNKEYTAYEMLRLVVQLWEVNTGIECGLDLWDSHGSAIDLLPQMTQTEVLEIASGIIEELKAYYGEGE